MNERDYPFDTPRNADGSVDRRSAKAIQADIDRKQNEALEAIERDRRIIDSAARMLPMSGKLTEEHIDGIRQAALEYIEANEVTHALIAKSIGLKSASTISEFLSGKPRGDADKTARAINAWMKQHHRAKRHDRPQHFITTSVVRNILTVIDETIRQSSVAVVSGPSGVSKTTVCVEACNTQFVGSVHVPCNMTCTSLSTFSALWCDCLGIPNYGNNGQRFARIVERLKDTNRCQLIDDAHKLLSSRSRSIRTTTPHCKPLEFIFDVHDATKVPIVLFGTVEVDEAIADESVWAGQLSSRVSTKYSISEMASESPDGGKLLFTKQDIIAFAESLGPTFKLSPGAIDQFTAMCNILGTGGLRRIGYLLSKAHAVMRSRRKKESSGKPGPIIQDDIQKAMTLMFGARYADHIRDRADELRKREVA